MSRITPSGHDSAGRTRSEATTTSGPALAPPRRRSRDLQRALLLAAADLVERVGLWQRGYWPGSAEGTPYRDGDPVCLLGALAVAAGHGQRTDTHPGAALEDDVVGRRASDAVRWYLDPTPGSCGAVAWSDEPGRTAGEVAAVLRGTARRLRGGR